MRHIGWYLALLAAAPAGTQAAPPGWQPVADTLLDGMRGGLDIGQGQGLAVSLGIERLVSVNGSTVSSTSASFSIGMAAAPQGAPSAGYTLVQNGAGNLALTAAMPNALGGLVLQNSANDQLLRSQTTISASVNSLAALRGMNLEGSLRQALAYVVGAR
ncbi:hypothetical protein ASC94_08315 [Massilia sp. Root418]|jgi:hypothetical protein|uniref:hypothetical protein n=1 Tax=Massilia sp. Root418 TaxID=1736532 RepID=UPI0006F7F51F|nr:hypothetical protein [Massilia sp. Root418]KQW96819.1 hypothetical protein ASC94_08315 [Massilia sp. Root418]